MVDNYAITDAAKNIRDAIKEGYLQQNRHMGDLVKELRRFNDNYEKTHPDLRLQAGKERLEASPTPPQPLMGAGAPGFQFCPVIGCKGDGRYVPPGKGHTCTLEQYYAAL